MSGSFASFAFEGGSGEVAPSKPAAKKRKRAYRQAKESKGGAVEILCFECRRSQSKKIQPALEKFMKPTQLQWDCKRCTFANSGMAISCEMCNNKRMKDSMETTAEAGPTLASESEACGAFCSRCRKDLNPNRKPKGTKSTNTLPIIARLRGYKRLAAEQSLPFVLKDHEAISLMRQDCVVCGAKASSDGHGITRFRHWPEGLLQFKSKCRKPYMGPFCKENVASACSVCNLMKGHRSIQSYVEAARHIATYRGRDIKGGGKDYGLYPRRFRNNISKRSRSSYITKSSTHQKTHCLTNEQFAAIVQNPCHYCGKEWDPPNHYNGLDRLDSGNRVYAVDTVVSCCGDCNVMKYKHSESLFLEHCLKIAEKNIGKIFEDKSLSRLESEPDEGGATLEPEERDEAKTD